LDNVLLLIEQSSHLNANEKCKHKHEQLGRYVEESTKKFVLGFNKLKHTLLLRP
jgi:hypothetical protein